ncbi:MAG: hypothetical protein ACYS15_04655 [Planctomycetota bacterium]|jgi:hypothetical protein
MPTSTATDDVDPADNAETLATFPSCPGPRRGIMGADDEIFFRASVFGETMSRGISH